MNAAIERDDRATNEVIKDLANRLLNELRASGIGYRAVIIFSRPASDGLDMTVSSDGPSELVVAMLRHALAAETEHGAQRDESPIRVLQS